MINLLPPEISKGYKYARKNVYLRKWLIGLVVVLVGLAGLGTYGVATIKQSTNDFNNQAAALSDQLQKNHLKETQQKVQDISSSLKLSVQVLSNEVVFSKLIQQIGAVMPSGSILAGLTINQVSGALNLSALSTSYYSATQIQVNLTNPADPVFSKVDINSISCTGTGSYPCQVSLNVLFNKTNQFLLVNQGKKP